jgi:hypothetical protein
MSYVAKEWAKKQRGYPTCSKLILLSLAVFHKPATGCVLRDGFLFETTEVSSRLFNRNFKILEEAGLIRRSRYYGSKRTDEKMTRYHLAFEADFGDPKVPENPAVQP